MSSREEGRYGDESDKCRLKAFDTYKDRRFEEETKLRVSERGGRFEDMSYTARCIGWQSTYFGANFDIINEASAMSMQNTPNMPNSKHRKRW